MVGYSKSIRIFLYEIGTVQLKLHFHTHVFAWHHAKSLNILITCSRDTRLMWHHAWPFHV